jgi:hypothetical protein
MSANENTYGNQENKLRAIAIESEYEEPIELEPDKDDDDDNDDDNDNDDNKANLAGSQQQTGQSQSKKKSQKPELTDQEKRDEKKKIRRALKKRRKQGQARYKRGDELSIALNQHITNISTIIHIIHSQDEVLKDLHDTLENSDWDPQDTGYDKNILPVPLGRARDDPEHMPVILESLRNVIKEREKFSKILDRLLETGRRSQSSVTLPFLPFW